MSILMTEELCLLRVCLYAQCVPESLSLKRSVLNDLDGAVDKDAIIASNSSSYTITEIMEGVELSHPERFVSLHSCKLSL